MLQSTETNLYHSTLNLRQMMDILEPNIALSSMDTDGRNSRILDSATYENLCKKQDKTYDEERLIHHIDWIKSNFKRAVLPQILVAYRICKKLDVEVDVTDRDVWRRYRGQCAAYITLYKTKFLEKTSACTSGLLSVGDKSLFFKELGDNRESQILARSFLMNIIPSYNDLLNGKEVILYQTVATELMCNAQELGASINVSEELLDIPMQERFVAKMGDFCQETISDWEGQYSYELNLYRGDIGTFIMKNIFIINVKEDKIKCAADYIMSMPYTYSQNILFQINPEIISDYLYNGLLSESATVIQHLVEDLDALFVATALLHMGAYKSAKTIKDDRWTLDRKTEVLLAMSGQPSFAASILKKLDKNTSNRIIDLMATNGEFKFLGGILLELENERLQSIISRLGRYVPDRDKAAIKVAILDVICSHNPKKAKDILFSKPRTKTIREYFSPSKVYDDNIKKMLSGMEAKNTARLLSSKSVSVRDREFIDDCRRVKAAEILSLMKPEKAKDLLSDLSDKKAKAAGILLKMSPSCSASILGHMSVERAANILNYVSSSDGHQIVFKCDCDHAVSVLKKMRENNAIPYFHDFLCSTRFNGAGGDTQYKVRQFIHILLSAENEELLLKVLYSRNEFSSYTEELKGICAEKQTVFIFAKIIIEHILDSISISSSPLSLVHLQSFNSVLVHSEVNKHRGLFKMFYKNNTPTATYKILKDYIINYLKQKGYSDDYINGLFSQSDSIARASVKAINLSSHR